MVRMSDSFEDLNASYDTPLEKRTGLARALNALATSKCQVLVALDQESFATDPSEGVIIETLANERYGAHLAVLEDRAVDWGVEAEGTKAAIAVYVEVARKLDDALQNDDSPEDWTHIQNASNLCQPRPNPEHGGRVEKPTLQWVSDQLFDRGMLSKHNTAYSPIQISRMLEKEEERRAEVAAKEADIREKARQAKLATV